MSAARFDSPSKELIGQNCQKNVKRLSLTSDKVSEWGLSKKCFKLLLRSPLGCCSARVRTPLRSPQVMQQHG
jgi:hypothetical protein